MAYQEKDFEAAIASWLMTEGGWSQGSPKAYDRAQALIPSDLLAFVQETQPRTWRRYAAAVGGDAEAKFLDAFCQALARGGASVLDLLRYGLQTYGVTFRVVGWQPETSLNPETQRIYEANRLRCVRQLRYSTRNENSLDMVLFVNGIPLVTMELKNQLTGQSVTDGKRQYMHDRDPHELIFQFRKRSLVHFTVDLYECWMTTRLAGKETRFLPFNQGSNGAGRVGGAGNPPNPDGFVTAYLWQNVLRRDVLLEIFHKYMLYEKRQDRMIFPRYHQLDVVTKLLADVRAHGAGRNYLIEHSAGSGKSNSIAWLAYRLSSLHNAADEKIFQSVIVVTDRRVLDSQLQDSIYQFDHVPGVVERITRNAKQLRDAINGGKNIIITTLQKFPVIFDEVRAQGARFAIIVDEAHSSQTGESARKLKRALGDRAAVLEEYARLEGEAEAARMDDDDRMLAELAAHGRQPNLSFFAFTATPKNKTLELFGQRDARGAYVPFHIYSMRQAIEEHFILDVLKNYVTYHMYYHIIKQTPENPELDSGQGIAAIKRFQALHPHNIAQKTEIIMEHFLRITRHKIGGRAKAMIVTASRLHAVRYYQSIQSYIERHGLADDVGVLVAFSGEVEDEGRTYTETGLNVLRNGEHVSEAALPGTFHGDDYHVLVVAEKYQTGFDEPLLHTMFVDKKLDGVKAVQTLSRLNRICAGKEDTFILDFVNTAEDIQAAFAPFYEGTVLKEATDADIIYQMKRTLDQSGIYGREDVAAVARLFYAGAEDGADGAAMGRLSGFLKPCLDRYAALPQEEAERFKSLLNSFNRAYAFITQIARMFDRAMQSFSVFATFLARALPKEHQGSVDLEDVLGLEYYRLKKDFDGTIALTGEGGELAPMTGGDGTTKQRKKAPLAELIDRINEANGTQFTNMDKVLTQIIDDFKEDAKAVNFAKANNERMFYRDYYKNKFTDILFARFAQNRAFMDFLAQHENAMQELMQGMVHQVYEGLRRNA